VINWGDGTSTTYSLNGGRAISGTHKYLDDNPTSTASDGYTITVTVTDDDLGVGSASAGLTVNNVAPAFNGFETGTTTVMQVNSTATVKAKFTDVGSQDTHACTFSWDDQPVNPDTTSTGTVSESGGNGTCTGTFVYSTPGVYSVGITLRDDDTGAVSTTYEYVVVYDPSGGFVTGGGFIMSPAGAYVADGSLAGKATFGFVSKYKKGATLPEGETEFQFHVASFNFHSTVYEWLVVSGAKAQYKGSGTVNGTGNYGFLLTATDGQLSGGGGTDKFRMKIWEKSTGLVVYDNRLGSSDDIDAANPQAISGGSIVVHK
jgi:hypothetical protein